MTSNGYRGAQPSTRNTRTAKVDGYGFAVVALVGVVVTVALAAVLLVSLYHHATDAIDHVRDCATQTIAQTDCTGGTP